MPAEPPNSFSDGTTAEADEVNDNFAPLYDRTNGTAVLSFSGSSAFASATVSHGLGQTPSRVLPGVSRGVSGYYWENLVVVSRNATSFVIQVAMRNGAGALAAPPAGEHVDVDWEAIK